MQMLWRYIKFLLRSTNHHGVHSPFVYDLVTKCFYDKTNYSGYKLIKTYRSTLLNSKETIEVVDLGAKSKVMKDTTRRISSIAKNAGTTTKRAKLLFRLVQYFEFKTILELGTSLGIGTYALAIANPKAKTITVEGCPNTMNFTRSKFSILQIESVDFKNGDFKNLLPNLTETSFDFIFFDGHHEKEATIWYFELLLEKVHNDSVFVFDDIYWSKGMMEAWDFIKQHPKVKVTIDTFFWGFVFFRKEQEKEQFTIRI